MNNLNTQIAIEQESLNKHQWLVQGIAFMAGSIFTIAAIIGLQMLGALSPKLSRG